MPAVVQPHADLYILLLPAIVCCILCMNDWAAQRRRHHEESSGAQTHWILSITGCAHLEQDCSECRIEGLQVVGQLHHDRLELGLCTERYVIVRTVAVVGLIGMHKTGCSGETRLVLRIPSSS